MRLRALLRSVGRGGKGDEELTSWPKWQRVRGEETQKLGAGAIPNSLLGDQLDI